MNAFDLQIIQYVNQFARHSPSFDEWVCLFQDNVLFKGGAIIPILWWVWFSKEQEGETKEYVLCTMMASFVALFLARLLAAVLPHRMRPMHDVDIHFVLPHGMRSGTLEGWSSFPSDHAVFFFALATGITLISRRLGYCVLVYSLFMICLPRIYLGLHSPTDLIAGALIGIGTGLLVQFRSIRKVMTWRMLEWEQKNPAAFYVSFFFVSYQMVILFDPLRDLAHHSMRFLKDM